MKTILMNDRIICELCGKKQKSGVTHCRKCDGVVAFNTNKSETKSPKDASYDVKNLIFYIIFFASIIVLIISMNGFGDLSDGGPFLYIFTPFLLLFFLKRSSKKSTSINRYLLFSSVFFSLILASYILVSYAPSGSADGLPFFTLITLEYIILFPFIIKRIYLFFRGKITA